MYVAAAECRCSLLLLGCVGVLSFGCCCWLRLAPAVDVVCFALFGVVLCCLLFSFGVVVYCSMFGGMSCLVLLCLADCLKDCLLGGAVIVGAVCCKR